MKHLEYFVGDWGLLIDSNLRAVVRPDCTQRAERERESGSESSLRWLAQENATWAKIDNESPLNSIFILWGCVCVLTFRLNYSNAWYVRYFCKQIYR